MFFNGLIRRLGTIIVEDLRVEFQSHLKSFDQEKFTTSIPLFGNSCWATINCSYRDSILSNVYIPNSPALDRIVREVLERAGINLYPVLVQVAWIRPGDKVDRHVDLQRIYAKTRRFHVQLEQSLDSIMHVYRGTEAVPFCEPIGTVYEFNNRVYHSAENNGSGLYMILVIDAARTGEVFTDEDNIIKDMNLQDSTNLPVTCN